MSTVPLVFARPTDLRVVEDSANRLVVRTVMHALWLGVPALAMILGMVGAALWFTVASLLAGKFLQAMASPFGTLAGVAFLALFLFGFLNQRLIATREGVEILSRFGPIVWRRRRLLYPQIEEINHVTITSDEGDQYTLEFKAAAVLAVRFGAESQKNNLLALRERLRQWCDPSAPWTQRPGEPPPPLVVAPPAYQRRRQQQSKKQRRHPPPSP
ncbi:MAG: hypothetical protein JO295_15535 [Verrucomicrobia bacterium]|nr:hypothetical protein [Verrucomicrobiota bacterium]